MHELIKNVKTKHHYNNRFNYVGFSKLTIYICYSIVRSRSREKMTSLRPRPVTATVTKPSWMQPEAIVGPRSRSVESRGSTASLTSVLEHDSYISLS